MNTPGQIRPLKQRLLATEAVVGCFHPRGQRGMCRSVRAAGYGSIPKESHFAASNDHVVTIAHIEGRDGIEHLAEICTVPGLDVVFLGPYDLSQSCGMPGQVDHPELERRMVEAIALARARSKVVGTFVESLESARRWRSLGVSYLAFSVDVALLYSQFRSIVKELHGGSR